MIEVNEKILFLDYLQNWQRWQSETEGSLISDNDVNVFNSIGALVHLISGGLMETVKSYDFITEIVSLNEYEKTKACDIIFGALDYSNEEFDKDE